MRTKIICKCERCREEKECSYYGSSGSVEEDKVQNGEWLCEPCVPLRKMELDEAIAEMERVLGK